MEYVPGGELFMHLRKQHKFSQSEAKFYAAEVLLAIEYLHKELDIIYRDLKPENILIGLEGHIKLTDFGLSTKNELRKTYCGTPEYLAPEIIKGELHDRAVDFWCLGCLIYEMLNGCPPFTSDTRQGLFQGILKQEI